MIIDDRATTSKQIGAPRRPNLEDDRQQSALKCTILNTKKNTIFDVPPCNHFAGGLKALGADDIAKDSRLLTPPCPLFTPHHSYFLPLR